MHVSKSFLRPFSFAETLAYTQADAQSTLRKFGHAVRVIASQTMRRSLMVT